MINAAVTVMLIKDEKIGFIRRGSRDTYANQLVAPGGKVEQNDGILIDDVPYFSIEHAAIRELKEETGLSLSINKLRYFCSLTLPNGRIVISLYAELNQEADNGNLIFMSEEEVNNSNEFTSGMKVEAKLLFKYIKEK